jgi:hypothetical protein
MTTVLSGIRLEALWKTKKNLVQNIRFEVPTAVTMNSTVFWELTPSSLVDVYWCFGGTYCLYLQGRRVRQANSTILAACLAYSSTLKMEAVRFPETPANFYQTTRRKFPEDSTRLNQDIGCFARDSSRKSLFSNTLNQSIYLSGHYFRGLGKWEICVRISDSQVEIWKRDL